MAFKTPEYGSSSWKDKSLEEHADTVMYLDSKFYSHPYRHYLSSDCHVIVKDLIKMVSVYLDEIEDLEGEKGWDHTQRERLRQIRYDSVIEEQQTRLDELERILRGKMSSEDSDRISSEAIQGYITTRPQWPSSAIRKLGRELFWPGG